MDEAGVSHGAKQREAAPQSVEDSNVDSNGLWAQLTLALVGGACLDLPKHECTRDLGLRRRARVRWRTDQPSYRDKGPTGL